MERALGPVFRYPIEGEIAHANGIGEQVAFVIMRLTHTVADEGPLFLSANVLRIRSQQTQVYVRYRLW